MFPYEAAPMPSRQNFQVIDGPLMSEYLLYFTVHETVQQSLFHLLMTLLPYQSLGKS